MILCATLVDHPDRIVSILRPPSAGTHLQTVASITMPTSPERASQNASPSGAPREASAPAATTPVKLRSAPSPASADTRPAKKRALRDPPQAEESGGEVVIVESGSTAGADRGAEPHSERTTEAVPPAFRPDAGPQPVASDPAGARNDRSGGAERVGPVSRDAGGSPGRPAEEDARAGGAERWRGPRLGRTRRSSRPTTGQRRYREGRPKGQHPQLSGWDLQPESKRSSLAGQERSIFRARGLLVSRFDFATYYALLEHNARELSSVFPTPPLWWPGDWGHMPITLPWEVSTYRSQLVSANPTAAVWKELYQLFLEQWAGGWDLWYQTIGDKSRMEALPLDLAGEMIRAGAFAFCAGSTPSASFRKFLEMHHWQDDVPDQRRSKAKAWEHIAERKKQEKEDRTRIGRGQCTCAQKQEQAMRRLGLEALIWEFSRPDEFGDFHHDGNRLAALAAVSLRYALNADAQIGRTAEMLAPRGGNYSPLPVGTVYNEAKEFGRLSYILPSRFATALSRLS